MSNDAAARADLEFRDGLKGLLDSPQTLGVFSRARQDYVRYAYTAMVWWIDQGNAGEPMEDPDDLAPRDRIILAWQRATGDAPASQVNAAIKANEAAMGKKRN
jgi:hypothetical protein